MGADGKSYYTFVDQTGNFVFEPSVLDTGDLYIGQTYYDDGVAVLYLAYGEGCWVIDKEGTIWDLSEDISSFMGSIIDGWGFTVNEGFKHIGDDIYRKLDGTPFDQAVMDENTVHVQLVPDSADN